MRYFLDERISFQEDIFKVKKKTQNNLKLFKAHLSEPQRKSDISFMKDQQNKCKYILLATISRRVITVSIFAHNSSILSPCLTAKGKMHHGNESEILDYVVSKELKTC